MDKEYKYTRDELIQESIEFRDQINDFYDRYFYRTGELYIMKQINGHAPPKRKLNVIRREMIRNLAKGVVGIDRRDDVIQMIKDKEYKDA